MKKTRASCSAFPGPAPRGGPSLCHQEGFLGPGGCTVCGAVSVFWAVGEAGAAQPIWVSLFCVEPLICLGRAKAPLVHRRRWWRGGAGRVGEEAAAAPHGHREAGCGLEPGARPPWASSCEEPSALPSPS